MSAFDAKLKVIWSLGRACRKAREGFSAYDRFCTRHGAPALLAAGVMAVIAALVHPRPVIWLMFAAEVFAGFGGVLLIQRHRARSARRQRDRSHSCEGDRS